MSETAVNPPTWDDPLRLDRCPECGYSLEGLPPEGVCPECGRGYDQSVVVLHGSARGNLATLSTARGMALLGPAFGWVAIFFLIAFASTAGYGAALQVIVGAYFIAGLILHLGSRFTNGRPDLVQVRLKSDGCVQMNLSAGSSAFRPYWRIWVWTGVPISGGFVLLFLNTQPDMVIYVAIQVVAIAGPPVYAYVRRAFRKSTEPQTDLTGGVSKNAPDWHSWDDVTDVSIRLIGPARHRLRIRKQYKPRWRDDVDFVDAEVACSPHQADELFRLIEMWRRDGSTAAPRGERS